MDCLYCSGKLELVQDVYHADRGGIHITIDQLPVYKCIQCGEIMLSGDEVRSIQKTLLELEKMLTQKAA